MMDVTLMISAGTGPRECEYAVRGIARAFMREAKAAGLKSELIEGENAGSILIRIVGPGSEEFAKARIGTVQWIGQSPFRPRHKRKNWFVGVSSLPRPEEIPDLDIKDVTFTAMRASGPGGQHVNKTNSAVRAVHRPSGIAVSAQSERSQHANKKICMIKLTAIFAQKFETENAAQKQDQWRAQRDLERGNAVRVYKGVKFQNMR